MGKVKRNLSGIYFPSYSDSMDLVCFEDHDKEKQTEILQTMNSKALRLLALRLSESINKIGDSLNIAK